MNASEAAYSVVTAGNPCGSVERSAALSVCQHRLAHLTRAGYSRTPDRAASLPSSSAGGAASSVRSWCTRSNSRSASARVRPFTASVIKDAEAVDIAHPCPSKRMSLILSSSNFRRTVRRSPQMGFNLSTLASAGSNPPKLRGRRLWSSITSRYRSLSSMASLGEQLARAFDARGKPVDFLEGVVEGERGACGRGQLEELHDRHGAMMSGPDGDAVLVENGSEVVRMHAGDGERHQACLVCRRTHDAKLRYLAQGGRRMVEERILVALGGVTIQALQKSHRRAQSDGSGDIWRAALELIRQAVVGGFGEGHGQNHLTAGLPGRHALEHLFAPVEDADAGGAEHLMARECIEIAAQILHVDLHVGHGLCAVDQRDDAAGLGGGDQAADRQDGPQRVRHMCTSEQARARAHQSHHRVHMDLAARIDGRDNELRSGLLANHLPRHDIGVVLQMRYEYLVFRLKLGSGVALCDEIDGFGGAAHENDLVPRPRVDEFDQPVARALVKSSRLLAQGMDAAMYVGVMVTFVVIDGVNHGGRTLCRGAVVQIGQRLAAHHARQYRKLPPHGVHVESLGPVSECYVLHRNFRRVCESGNWEINALSIAARAEATDMPVRTSARNAYTSRL